MVEEQEIPTEDLDLEDEDTSIARGIGHDDDINEEFDVDEFEE